MRTKAQLRKIQGDVERVLRNARILLRVDEKGNLVERMYRGEAPRRHQVSPWLDVIAIIGPLWDAESECWRQAVWCEIGMSRGVPYTETSKTFDGKRIRARSRILIPTDEQLLAVFPYITHHIEHCVEEVMSGWKERSGYVKRTKQFLSRQRVSFMHTTPMEMIKGICFRVAKRDLPFCRIIASTSLAKHVEESARLGRLLGLCLKDEPCAQTPEAWRLVRDNEDVLMARDVLLTTPPFILAGALIYLPHIDEDVCTTKKSEGKKVDRHEQVLVILSLLEVVKKELHKEVLWWIDNTTLHDYLPNFHHVRMLHETQGRRNSLCVEIGIL